MHTREVHNTASTLFPAFEEQITRSISRLHGVLEPDGKNGSGRNTPHSRPQNIISQLRTVSEERRGPWPHRTLGRHYQPRFAQEEERPSAGEEANETRRLRRSSPGKRLGCRQARNHRVAPFPEEGEPGRVGQHSLAGPLPL